MQIGISLGLGAQVGVAGGSAAWLDDAWSFRREVTLDNSSNSNTLTNYQARVNVTYDADMQADFGDVRFTGANDELIPHWLESKTDSVSAVFWVKVPTIPASATTNIYLYYGNALADDASDGYSTFLLFDDKLFNSSPLARGTSGAWDDDRVLGGGIGYDAATRIYHTYYRGEDGAGGQKTGHATSPDLVTWTKDAGNPILTATEAWEGTGLALGGTPLTDLEGNFVTHSNKYWLLYRTSDTPQDAGLASADSPDGPWTKHASNPIFEGSGSGWDSAEARPFSLVKEGATFYLFYQGRDDTVTQDFALGYATSSDLLTWVRSGSNPILSASIAWENGNVIDPIIRKYGATYYLFYSGDVTSTSQENGYATASAIGGPYAKFANNPITPNGNSFPQVIKRGDTWYMLTDDHNTGDKQLYTTVDLSAGAWEWPARTGTVGSVAAGVVTYQNGEGQQSARTFLYKAIRTRANFKESNGGTQLKTIGFVVGVGPPVIRLQTTNSASALDLRIRDVGAGANTQVEAAVTDAMKIYDVMWTAGKVLANVNDGTPVVSTTDVPGTAMPINLLNSSDATADLLVDWVAVREYSDPEPTATVGDEETP